MSYNLEHRIGAIIAEVGTAEGGRLHITPVVNGWDEDYPDANQAVDDLYRQRTSVRWQ